MIRKLEPFAYGYFHSKAESKERRIADGISFLTDLFIRGSPFMPFRSHDGIRLGSFQHIRGKSY